MGRKLIVQLTDFQRAELEQGYHQGSKHSFRQRCRMVLLKSHGLNSKDISELVGIKAQNQINHWIKQYLKHYAEKGIAVLLNEPGQGRKPILDQEKDQNRVREAVELERLRLSQAKLLLEQQMGKSFHLKTLKRFLKKLSASSNESNEQ